MKPKYALKLIHFTLLTVAVCAWPSISCAEDWTYSVRPGDTLWELCKTFTKETNCWRNIGPYNSVDYPRALKPGTRIRFPVLWLKYEPQPATVTHVQGTAYLVGHDNLQTPLSLGQKLLMGSKITTQQNSLVNILFGNGATLTMEADSEIVFDQLTVNPESSMVDTKVNLSKGSVQTKVPKRKPAIQFEVHTPSAVAAVRGTNFRVTSLHADDQAMRSEVFEGEVNVSKKKQSTALPAGYGLLAAKTKPLPDKVKLLQPATVVSPDALARSASPTQPNTTRAPATLHKTPFTIAWKKISKSTLYKVQLFQQKSRALIWSQTSKKPKINSPYLKDGCYQLRVSGIDRQGFQGMPSDNRFCIEEKLDPPEGLQFTKTSIEWQPVAKAHHYKLLFSETKNFDTPVITHASVASLDMDNFWQYRYLKAQAIDEHNKPGQFSKIYFIEPRTKKMKGLAFFIVLAMAILGI